MTIRERLKELGIELPEPAKPVASYLPFVRTGNLISVSGQVSLSAGREFKGRVPDQVSLEDAILAARLCGINILAQLNAALDGDLDRVVRIVKLGGFVNCTPDFTDHPRVINGASDLMAEVFGEAGKHSRAAVGASSLPLGVTVEVDALVEVA
ncbi:MAG: RidA family protein [Proteobacteria bacterium]|nr:RidA family protein [Pseudomonadota bacterium]MCH8322753.1 RidA family protein [Pseudomonadota bacterium]